MRAISIAVVLLLFASAAVRAQHPPAHPPPPFIPSHYDSPNYRVSRARRTLADLTVSLVQVAAAHPDDRVKYCSSWIELRRGRQLEQRLHFVQDEPSNPPYGLFIAPNQPVPDYLSVVKLGDLDGRLILIHKSGHVINLPGGAFFLDREQQWLYSQHFSDVSGLTVFDLREGRVIWSTLAVPQAARWYRSGSEYLFTRFELDGRTENREMVFLVRPRQKQVLEQSVTPAFFNGLRQVHFDFAPPAGGNCRFQH